MIRKELITAMLKGNCLAFDFGEVHIDFMKEFTDKNTFNSCSIFDYKFLHTKETLHKWLKPEDFPMDETGKRRVKDFPVSPDFTIAIVCKHPDGKAML